MATAANYTPTTVGVFKYPPSGNKIAQKPKMVTFSTNPEEKDQATIKIQSRPHHHQFSTQRKFHVPRRLRKPYVKRPTQALNNTEKPSTNHRNDPKMMFDESGMELPPPAGTKFWEDPADVEMLQQLQAQTSKCMSREYQERQTRKSRRLRKSRRSATPKKISTSKNTDKPSNHRNDPTEMLDESGFELPPPARTNFWADPTDVEMTKQLQAQIPKCMSHDQEKSTRKSRSSRKSRRTPKKISTSKISITPEISDTPEPAHDALLDLQQLKSHQASLERKHQ